MRFLATVGLLVKVESRHGGESRPTKYSTNFSYFFSKNRQKYFVRGGKAQYFTTARTPRGPPRVPGSGASLICRDPETLHCMFRTCAAWTRRVV